MTHSSRTHTTALGLGCLTLLGIATAASAAPTGFEFEATTVDQSTWAVANQDARDLVSVKVYIAFDDPLDQLVIVNGKPGANISVSTDDLLGFFQSAVGNTNTSETRASVIIDMFPCAGADSYVSIGLLNNDSGTDAIITTGMDWATFNGGGALESLDTDQGGGWLVTPDDHQGDATDGHVFIGQFTVASGSTVTATLNYMYVDNATSTSIEIDGAAFSTVATVENADVGRSDFNGDGKDDVLWQCDEVTDDYYTSVLAWLNWNGTDAGYTSAVLWNADVSGEIPAAWQIQGSGNLLGGDKASILWRGSAGEALVWTLDDDTGTYSSSVMYSAGISGWVVRAIGDFNGDGQDDVLWQCDEVTDDYYTSVLAWVNWNGTDAGYTSAVLWNADVSGEIPTTWAIQGSGDFDGDGRDGILWRGGSGEALVWTLDDDTGTYSSSTMYSAGIADWAVRAPRDIFTD